jgi:hypothetical protein
VPPCSAAVFAYGYTVYYGLAAVIGYLAFSMTFWAAAFVYAGFVKSIYLAKISSSVSISSSISSSIVASGGCVVVRVVLATCAVGMFS